MDARLASQLRAAGLDPDKLPAGTVIGGKTIEQLGAEAKAKKKERKKKEPSKTEAEFGRHLGWLIIQGRVTAFWYEPFRLTLTEPDPQTGRPMVYIPDFMVVFEPGGYRHGDPRPRLLEIKGAHIWEDSIIKFRAAYTLFGAAFRFSMLQKKQGAWETVLGETWTE